MLKEINKRPPWATRIFDAETEDYVDGVPSIVMIYDNEWFFDGPLGAFLMDMLIPRKLEIYCNMITGVSVIRMIFEEPPVGRDKVIDGQNGDGTYRVLYSEFETLSVAMLWNHMPSTIHGMPSNRITIFVEAGDAQVRFIADSDLILNLTFEDDLFMMGPVDEQELVQQLIDSKVSFKGDV